MTAVRKQCVDDFGFVGRQRRQHAAQVFRDRVTEQIERALSRQRHSLDNREQGFLRSELGQQVQRKEMSASVRHVAGLHGLRCISDQVDQIRDHFGPAALGLPNRPLGQLARVLSVKFREDRLHIKVFRHTGIPFRR